MSGQSVVERAVWELVQHASRAFALDGPQQVRLADVARACAVLKQPVRLRLNRNRRTLISLRAGPERSWTLSLHVGLLDEPATLAELPRWISSRGRGTFPAIRAGMSAVSGRLAENRQHQEGGDNFSDLDPLAGPFDLQATFDRIHATWFAQLSKPLVSWSRNSYGRQTHIRFGCYRRVHGERKQAQITIHPRLDQPWVARIFVEHVLYHELCHHAQACQPVRGERIHGPRFRAWERQLPDHERAMAWERSHLRHFLDGTAPVRFAKSAPVAARDASLPSVAATAPSAPIRVTSSALADAVRAAVRATQAPPAETVETAPETGLPGANGPSGLDGIQLTLGF